jgi:signal transduction histidine kinase
VWLLRHRHAGVATPTPIPFRSEFAEPMRRALGGESGTVVGLDYRGETVLAAYEKILGVDWGVVAKIDMKELRRPFMRAGLIVSGTALAAIAIGLGLTFRTMSPLVIRIEARTEELHDAHERLRLHASETSLAMDRERRKLAGDLHDGIGQLLALTNIKLGLLRKTAEDKMLDPRFEEIESLVVEAREQSRAMTLELCPPVLYELGLTEAIRWLANDFERRYGLRVALQVDGSSFPLGETTRISLFRSLNELLVNVGKHAKTNKALVRVSHWDGSIMITVEDNGIGFDPSSRATGYGLFSVRERLHHLGGIAKIESIRGIGTTAALIAPIGSADSETSREEA